jgi:hypothetical protein
MEVGEVMISIWSTSDVRRISGKIDSYQVPQWAQHQDILTVRRNVTSALASARQLSGYLIIEGYNIKGED